jgi:hypothetical protein
MVDPAVGAKIYPWIFWDHKRVTGYEAAQILHEQQMKGLEMLTARGVLTKINSVLIPGINDEHLIEVNREVKKRGAFLHNIMPLISEAEHGTCFGLTGQRGPTAQELKAVQDACMGGANLMRHCRQCRADAVGLLGEDRSEEFTLDKIEEMEVVYDLDKRKAYQDRSRPSARPSMRPSRTRWRRRWRATWPRTEGAGRRGHRRPGASTSTSATPPNSRSSRCPRRRPCSSATAAWTCTARAATARTSNCPPSSRDQRLPRGAGGQDRRLPARRAGAAGIEPVERYAHEFIEKAALPGSTTTAARRQRRGRPRIAATRDPAGRVHRQRGGVTRASSGSHPQQERHHVPEDHRLHLHRLLGLRTGVPQRRHPRKRRRIRDRSQEVHRMRRALRQPAMRRGVPGRRLHRAGVSRVPTAVHAFSAFNDKE